MPLKDRKDWRYIGKPRAIVDLKDIAPGRAVYGIDVVVPDMKQNGRSAIRHGPSVRNRLAPSRPVLDP